MATPVVPVETAALNALGNWLASRLEPYDPDARTGVEISYEWPAPDAKLPRQGITLLFAGPPEEFHSQPSVDSYESIHDEISAKLNFATVGDDGTAIVVINAVRAAYEAHRVNTGAHEAADSTNVVTEPAATDGPTAILLANNMQAVLVAHFANATAHATADSVTSLAGVPPASNSATLYVLVNAIVHELNRHYVARLYTWRIADMDQPVQLDLWSTSPAWRDDLWAKLEPLLNASGEDSAGFDSDDPVRLGTVVPLAEGWTGFADFDFLSPERIETPTAVQQDECRMLLKGTMQVSRLVKAQSARMAAVQLRNAVGKNTSNTTVSWDASGDPTASYS